MRLKAKYEGFETASKKNVLQILDHLKCTATIGEITDLPIPYNIHFFCHFLKRTVVHFVHLTLIIVF